jgi:hypothetical protein
VLASDVISDWRTILNEPSTSGRFTDANALSYLNIANKELIREIRFPESRCWFNTTTGVQEYELNEMLRILRCYYAGESVPRTDIPTLEGYQIQMYDNTAQGAGPGGGIPSGVPTLYYTSVAPQWSSAQSQGAPGISGGSTSFAQPYSQSWYPGRRPVYYVRGGNLGIVPPPGGTVPIVLDCIRQPSQIMDDSTALTLPDICRQALMFKMGALAYLSDRGAEAQALRSGFLSEYAKELTYIRHWQETYTGTAQGIKVQTQRSIQGTRGQFYTPNGRS